MTPKEPTDPPPDTPTKTDPEPLRRPPGLLVIVGVYTLGALLSVLLIRIGTPAGQTFGAVFAPVCVLIAYGLWALSELARKLVVALLALALVGEGLLFSLHIAGLVGVLELPTNVEPARAIAGAMFRVWFTWWMLAYLRRDDVRALFAEAQRRASERAAGLTADDDDDDGRW